MADFITQSVQIKLEVPQSHWVGKVLPVLGYGEVKIIELPIARELIAEEFSISLEEFEYAQQYFDTGDYDKAVEHCRNAIEPIKDKLPELKSLIGSDTEYAWVKEIGIATYDWLDKIFKKTRNLTSKPHHLPSIGHFSRHDAEVIMLVATALIAYVGRLSASDEKKGN